MFLIFRCITAGEKIKKYEQIFEGKCCLFRSDFFRVMRSIVSQDSDIVDTAVEILSNEFPEFINMDKCT